MGFWVLLIRAELLYKTTDYYASHYDHCIAWDDPDSAIDWPLDGAPILSSKDAKGRLLVDLISELNAHDEWYGIR
jgi:dTDP-4-dehydrorhamnose 3,5-epimerase